YGGYNTIARWTRAGLTRHQKEYMNIVEWNPPELRLVSGTSYQDMSNDTKADTDEYCDDSCRLADVIKGFEQLGIAMDKLLKMLRRSLAPGLEMDNYAVNLTSTRESGIGTCTCSRDYLVLEKPNSRTCLSTGKWYKNRLFALTLTLLVGARRLKPIPRQVEAEVQESVQHPVKPLMSIRLTLMNLYPKITTTLLFGITKTTLATMSSYKS
ncbi:hypothetical protein DPMN_171374, partial [Dreissena polymorpha]